MMPTRGRVVALAASLATWLIPRRLGYALVDLASLLCYLLAGSYRRAALANLSQVLGRPTSDRAVRRAARACFITSGRNFWDLCSLPHYRPEHLLRYTDVAPDAWPTLLNAIDDRRGVIVVTGHVGAFDTGGQLMVLLPTRPLILTASTTVDWLFETVTHLRTSWGNMVEPATAGSLRRVIAHLRRGGLVGLAADRDIAKNGHPVSLFGRQTTLPVGPVRLALATGAPMVAIFCPRVGDRYVFQAEPVPIERTGNFERDLDYNLRVLASVFERAIQTWPNQWVVFEPIWPEQSDGRRPS